MRKTTKQITCSLNRRELQKDRKQTYNSISWESGGGRKKRFCLYKNTHFLSERCVLQKKKIMLVLDPGFRNDIFYVIPKFLTLVTVKEFNRF